MKIVSAAVSRGKDAWGKSQVRRLFLAGNTKGIKEDLTVKAGEEIDLDSSKAIPTRERVAPILVQYDKKTPDETVDLSEWCEPDDGKRTLQLVRGK